MKTQSCQYCENGTEYWAKTHECLEVTKLINFNGDVQFLGLGDHPVQDEKDASAKLIDNGPTSFCPEDKPYPIKNVCSSCSEEDPYFNLDIKDCSNCGEGYVYVAKTYSCEELYYVTNIETMDNYIVNETSDLDQLVKDVNDLKSTKETETCPEDKPYSNGK